MQVIFNTDESTPLVGSIQEKEKKSGCFGRAWNWIKEKTTPSSVAKGVAGTVSLISCSTLGYFAAKELFYSPEYTFAPLHRYGLGVGVSLPFLGYAIFPDAVGTAAADGLSRWSFEILYAMVQLYKHAGSPIDECGLWDTKQPPDVVKKTGVLAFSAIAAAYTLMTARSFSALFWKEIREVPQQQERTIQLFLESSTAENRQFIVEQMAKGVLGAGFLGLNKLNVLQENEFLCLGYYLVGHAVGGSLCRGYLYLQERGIIETVRNERLKLVIDKIGAICELLAFGVFFAWPSDPSYLLSGAMAGSAKVVILAKFQALATNDEKVTDLVIKRTDNIAKGFFLGLALVWEGLSLANKNVQVGDIVRVACLVSSFTVAYPLTRHLAREFRPGHNSSFFNSLRFYLVNHQEILILPYMFLDTSKDTVAWQKTAKQLISAVSLGLSAGNNRALQGIRSYQSPAPVADLAQIIAWYILYQDSFELEA